MHCRCPHCHNPVEIIDDQELTDISCPSCGSNFHLVSGGDATQTLPYEPRTIGHFELLEQAGVGSFGSVWKARDTNLDRIVAVKIPRTEALTEAQQSQFFKEARAAAQVKHPSIVGVHEVGRTENEIYIVSDFIDGAPLSDWIKAKPPSIREAAKLCATIADALHAAHEAGVVHRDLKPSNIMMDLEGNPHVADFGLAKRDAGEITMTMDGQILGTPAYMSPEQAKGDGHNADRRSDVYSLGVILYQLLTGELPFRGDTRMLIVQILQDDPAPPRKLSSQVPRDLETICLKCLSKTPDRRYETAKELSGDLTRWLAGEAILARPPGNIESGWRWLKNNQIQFTRIVVVILTLVMMAFAGLAYYANSQRNAAIAARNRAETAREQEALAKNKALDARDEAQAAAVAAEESRYVAIEQTQLAMLAREEASRHLEESQRLQKLVEVSQDREHEAELALQRVEKQASALAKQLASYRNVLQSTYEILLEQLGANDVQVKSIADQISKLNTLGQ